MLGGRYTRRNARQPTPVHLDAAITTLNGTATAHMPVPVSWVDTDDMEEDEEQIWQLSDATHAALTDRAKVDLFQGRCPASKA